MATQPLAAAQPHSLVGDTTLTARIAALIEPSLAGQGYDLVRVVLTGQQRRTLQVMIERSDGGGVNVDDCAAASTLISALLDVEDPVSGAYDLEVSSPGIDRPLTRAQDFARWAGHEARIELRAAQPGPDGTARRRYTGRLMGLADEAVRLEVDGAAVELPLAAIGKAKLVLTDALIAAATSH